MSLLKIRRPVLRYHGGKWRLASWVISHFPKHDIYIEPFGGAASVLMRKDRVRYEVYNELDEEITNVFRVLRDPQKAAELERLLRFTPYSRAEFLASYECGAGEVENVRRTICRSYLGFSSASVTKAHRTGFRSKNIRSNKSAAADFATYPEYIAAFAERLRGVTIESKPAVDVIRQYIHEPGALIYVDPPYLPSTRYNGARYGHCYRHEMTEEQHIELAEVLRSNDAVVVISGYRSELYEDLYRGWRVVEKKTLGSGNKRSVERTERLWISPSAMEEVE